MEQVPRLSLVIPVRDEAESLEPLHRELDAALASLPGPVEILFVDDASGDASLERLGELARKDPRVRLLALERPSGQSAALAAGFQAARGELTATLDADLQNDPADLPRLLAALDGADVVNGVRTPRRDAWTRRLAARLGNGFRNRLTAEAVSDVGCGLRVMRSAHLRRVRPFDGMHRFLPTLLALEGARVVELPVSHRPRRYGRSKVAAFGRLWRGIPDVLAVRWMQRRQLCYRVRELRESGSEVQRFTGAGGRRRPRIAWGEEGLDRRRRSPETQTREDVPWLAVCVDPSRASCWRWGCWHWRRRPWPTSTTPRRRAIPSASSPTSCIPSACSSTP